MVRMIKQLVIESLRSVANSKEFKNAIYEMVREAVFGILNLIKQGSLFLYQKVVELGKLLGLKINSLIKRIPRS